MRCDEHFFVDFLRYPAARHFVLIPSVDTLYAVMTEPMRAILQDLYQPLKNLSKF